VIELGKLGSAGAPKNVAPVLRDGVVVAVLRASNWKEAAFAVVADREWVFTKRKGELTARWAADPDGTVRFRARQTSFWRSTWAVDLAGKSVRVESASAWRGTHRFLVEGQEVAVSGSTGGWGQRPTLTVRAEAAVLPLEAQVFLLWMELVLRRRADAGATAGVVASTGATG
jgi:hypothetical protein